MVSYKIELSLETETELLFPARSTTSQAGRVTNTSSPETSPELRVSSNCVPSIAHTSASDRDGSEVELILTLKSEKLKLVTSILSEKFISHTSG